MAAAEDKDNFSILHSEKFIPGSGNAFAETVKNMDDEMKKHSVLHSEQLTVLAEALPKPKMNLSERSADKLVFSYASLR